MVKHDDLPERSVIGGLLIDAKKAVRHLWELKPEHFESAALGLVYQEAMRLYSATGACDIVMLTGKLAAMPDMNLTPEKARGLLLNCMDACPTLHNVRHYAEMILAAYRSREARKIAGELITITGDEEIQQAGEKLLTLLQHSGTGTLSPMEDVIAACYPGLFDTNRLKRRIDLGLADVDKLLMGLLPSDFCILAARPGVGKSALAAAAAMGAAEKGRRVAVFSLEMSKEQLFQRWISMRTNVSMSKFRARAVLDDQEKIWAAVNAMKDLALYVDDSGYSTVADIRAKCRMKGPFNLIVIDYLQLVRERAGTRYPNRAEAVGQISRDLKMMAKELDVPVMALCQLNRESNGASEPSISELRESGSLEQDADQILLLWNHSDTAMGCKVGKNRHGPTGTALLRFDKEKMQIVSSTETYQRKREKMPWEE